MPDAPNAANLRLRMLAQRRSVVLLLAGLSAVGYAMAALLLVEHGVGAYGGEGGVDVFAYWTAGRHLLDGEPLYGLGIGGRAAFLYPPPLAQLFMPLALAPFWVVMWLWRAILLVALRVAVGSWRNAGLALLLWPPVILELDAGNVHLLVAAAVAETIRGRSWSLAPVALTKFATLAAVPLALRFDRRGLLRGALGAAVIVGLSMLLAPDLWGSWLAFVISPPSSVPGWYNIGDRVPLGLRLGAAALAAVAAIRVPRMAAVAATLALPVLWLHGLSTGVAIVATPMRTGVVGPLGAAPTSGGRAAPPA